ncbi:VPS10 domain-containing receptor SorCS1 [Lingula anatina]|uniref:VPS10 domain-containing receptor SorCS1 n=1 Tax=Lingula anatina TaxID=7574 RepID=A0A1S3JML3_LINAN|nr:VPS10 domain-containing receptor SorCS1 [Lingula anatina]|eukprot:XP_013411635.1 VPS10 domain-containing receptor SorCS1 [Lingula anatina]
MEIADPVTGQMHYKTCIIEWTESDNVHCSPLTDLSSALGTIAVESLVVQNEYIFVQKNTQRSAEMYVSYRRQPFKKAYFPQGLESVEFELYDTDEHQVFVAVRHWTDVLNLYLSDITGQYFVLSLENVVTMDFGTFSFSDLIEIKSTPGVFLSNVRTTYGIVTMVTYDKGGNWSRLAAADPKCRLPDCSLNLHMMYSSFKYSIPQGIFSKKNAPGIIIGLGNEDGYLNMQSKSNSYISRDGGHTWTKLLSGNYQFNILDQGGALMAVQPGVYTRHIQYSTDVGGTWKPVTLNVSLMIDGLLNEPGITTLVSSAYGHHQTGDYGWVVIQFNLTGAFSGKCTDKNYEHWSPGGEHACTLGERAVYQRRKQNADCYNGQDYERPINSSVCTCTVEDFECDYGYENQAGQCVVAAWYDQSPVEDCPVGTKYSKSSGYRKVAADKCKGGVEDDKKYKPTMTDCPVLPPGDMRLESSATTGATTTGTNVTFYFRQGKGSKTTTHYNCTFGDGHQQSMQWNDTTPGVMKFTHQFLKVGTYHVTVQATNEKGQASVALPLTVEDRIVDLEVELPRGALQNEPSVFTAIPVFGLDNGNTQDLKQTHFIWQFSHQETPTLSWNGTVSFKCSEPGNYTVHVTAVNAVSSYHKALTVRVYGELVVVQLWFENLPLEVPPSLLINRIIFRRSFEKAVVKEISEKKILGTEVGEIQAAMLLKEPLRVDVVILPPTVNKNKITATQVAQKLIDAVAAHNLSIPLGSIDTVTPTKAVIVKEITHQWLHSYGKVWGSTVLFEDKFPTPFNFSFKVYFSSPVPMRKFA